MSLSMIRTLCLGMCREGCDIRFIAEIVGIVTRDDCCVGFAIKCSTHKSRLCSLDAVK